MMFWNILVLLISIGILYNFLKVIKQAGLTNYSQENGTVYSKVGLLGHNSYKGRDNYSDRQSNNICFTFLDETSNAICSKVLGGLITLPTSIKNRKRYVI